MKTIDRTHGSPYDRGSADAYYKRPFKPHYYPNSDVGFTEPVYELTTEQEADYMKGYQDQVFSGDFKDYD